MTPKRLMTASKAPVGNGRSSANATLNCAFVTPRWAVARPAAATISGIGSTPTTLPWDPTTPADAERRLAGTCGDVQNGVAARDPSIGDERLGDGLEHLADRFAVLFPVGRGAAPAVDDGLFGCH